MAYIRPEDGFDFEICDDFKSLLLVSKIPKDDLLKIVSKTHDYMDYILCNRFIKQDNGKICITKDECLDNPVILVVFKSIQDIVNGIIDIGQNSYIFIKKIDYVGNDYHLHYISVSFDVKIPGISEYCLDRIRCYKISKII